MLFRLFYLLQIDPRGGLGILQKRQDLLIQFLHHAPAGFPLPVEETHVFVQFGIMEHMQPFEFHGPGSLFPIEKILRAGSFAYRMPGASYRQDRNGFGR